MDIGEILTTLFIIISGLATAVIAFFAWQSYILQKEIHKENKLNRSWFLNIKKDDIPPDAQDKW